MCMLTGVWVGDGSPTDGAQPLYCILADHEEWLTAQSLQIITTCCAGVALRAGAPTHSRAHHSQAYHALKATQATSVAAVLQTGA